jgi:murein DD-endopeptidase MepM/ murein hydrolase activator NlpD
VKPKATKLKLKPKSKPKPKPAPAKPKPTQPKPPQPSANGRFPVAGPHTYGGNDARFGAGRTGHVHQGQDIIAAAGTPVIAPIDGVIEVRATQAAGAGNYLVLQGTDGRAYVFMHLLTGADRVARGDTVRAGQQLSEVGSTGRSDGPHLHFEIWTGRWYAPGSVPIDPLPALKSWDR